MVLFIEVAIDLYMVIVSGLLSINVFTLVYVPPSKSNGPTILILFELYFCCILFYGWITLNDYT